MTVSHTSVYEQLECRRLLATAPFVYEATVHSGVENWEISTTVSESLVGPSQTAANPGEIEMRADSVNPSLKWMTNTSPTVVFVDAGIESYQSLVDEWVWSKDSGDLHPVDVIVLDSNRDGIEQITDKLRNYHGVSAVHILSHGFAGGLQLGNTRLDHSNLDDYGTQLSQWSSSLDATADILLYGCNVADGELGIEFVDRFAAITGADIAASNDLTGATGFSGDWSLEISTGPIEVDSFRSSEYQFTLETLNEVIDRILSSFDGVSPSTEMVFQSGDPIGTTGMTVPNSVDIGDVPLGNSSDLTLDNLTLTFPTTLDYIPSTLTWSGGVGVTAGQGTLLPDILNVGVIDDAYDSPRRVKSASNNGVLPNGHYEVVFTLAGDHQDLGDNVLFPSNELAVLNSVPATFNDLDFDDSKEIFFTSVSYDESTDTTTVITEYNFDPGDTWNGGSLLAAADPDTTDDGDSVGVSGTVQLAPGNPDTIFSFNTLEAADIGFPRWLDIEIENLQMEFDDFRANDSSNFIKLDASLNGFETGNFFVNQAIRTNPLFQLNVTGSVDGLQFDMNKLAEGSIVDGQVKLPKNPITNLTGLSGEISGKMFGAGEVSAGFIVKAVSIDNTGAITTQDSLIVDTYLYGAVTGSLAFVGTDVEVDDGNGGKTTKKKGAFDAGFNFAVSELGPLQLFVYSDVNILLEPVSGLSISELRGGIRFNANIEDLQVRPPIGTVENSGTVTPFVDGAATKYRIQLTTTGHNLKVGDEIKITAAGNPAFLSGKDPFVVTAVDGDVITYVMDVDPGAFSTADIKKISISDPLDLRDPGFSSTKNLSLGDWEDQLDQAVVNQATTGAEVTDGMVNAESLDERRVIEGKVDIDDNNVIDGRDDGTLFGYEVIDGLIDFNGSGTVDSSDDGFLPPASIWDVLLEKAVIEVGASLSFDPRIPDSLLSFDADLLFDTEGRFLITGDMNLLLGTVSVPAKLFADFSDTSEGVTRFLYLSDLPAVPQNTSDVKPLLVSRAAVTFETLIGGEPATLDAISGLPVGVGIDVASASVVDLSGIGAGPWEVTFSLDLPNTVPSDTFAPGDSVIIVNSDPETFNGTHEIQRLDDAADSITVRIGTRVIDGKLDINGDGNINDSDDGVHQGIPVIDGSLDLNKDGEINDEDAGEVFTVITVATEREVVGYAVIAGMVDVDGDNNVNGDADDDGVLGENPGTLVTVGEAANLDDLGDGFRITIDGGVDLNIPFVTTLSLEGEASMDFTVGTGDTDIRIDFEFDVQLSETNVGAIGRANGAFHFTFDANLVDAGNGSNLMIPEVEVWGAAILTTDFGFLEPIGLYASATGLLRINSSDEVKPDEQLTDVNGNTVMVALPEESFAIRIDGDVDFRIEDASVFQIAGSFVLEFSPAGFNVALFRDDGSGVPQPAVLRLGPTGSTLLEFEVLGFLAIRDNAFAANLVLSANASLPLNLATMMGRAVLVVNTSQQRIEFEIPGGGTDPNRPTGLTMTIPASQPLNPSSILAGPSPNGPPGGSLDDLINGSPTWVEGAAGAYGVVFVDAEMELLEVLDFELSGYVLLSQTVASLEANFYAGGNFLGLASASVEGSIFFSSDGEFELLVDGRVQLGPDWININGGADLTISYLDNNGKASGGNGTFVLDVTGSLSVGLVIDIDPFPRVDINVDPALTVNFNSGTGSITVGVTYPEPFWDEACVDLGLLGKACVPYPNFRDATYTFVVGTLEVTPPPPIVLAQVDPSGVLTVNVGSQANRIKRNLLADEINEDVTLGATGPLVNGAQTITVSMFGVVQQFPGVKRIRIDDMDDGVDVIEIASDVAVPTWARLGDGDDRLTNLGTAMVTAYGNDGNDRLNGGQGIDALFGGTGDDVIEAGFNDSISGDAGRDTLIFELDSNRSEEIGVTGNGADFELAVGTDTLSAGDIELLTIGNADGRMEADTFTVNDVSTTALEQINLNLGDDGLKDTVIVNGTQEVDTFDVSVAKSALEPPEDVDFLRISKQGGVKIDVFDANPSSGGDVITMRPGGGSDVVNIYSTLTGVATTVDAGTGEDTVNVRAISAPLTINGGDDSDIFNVGSEAPIVTGGNTDGIRALLTVNGDENGPGDRLTVDNSGDTTGHTGTLTDSTVAGLFGNGGEISYNTIENLLILLGIGDDTFTIESTHSNPTEIHSNVGEDKVFILSNDGETDISTGAGDDIVIVSSVAIATEGDLEGILAPISIDVGEDSNQVFISDFDDTNGNPNVVVTSEQITGFAPATIAYFGAGTTSLVLNGSNGSAKPDIFEIRSLLMENSLFVIGNAGDDVAFVRASALGDVSLTGDAGNDQFLVNLVGNSNRQVNVDGGTGLNNLTVVGTSGNNPFDMIAGNIASLDENIVYSNIGDLTVNGIQGDDTFDFQSTGAAVTTLIGYDGADRFVVHNTTGATEKLVAFGGSGNDEFQLYAATGGTWTKLYGQSGDDHFDLGSTDAEDNGDLSRLSARVVVQGNSDHDVLNINDRGANGEYSYRVFPVWVVNKPGATSRPTFAGIQHLGMDDLRLAGTDQKNEFEVTPSFHTAYFLDGNLPAREMIFNSDEGDYLNLMPYARVQRKLHFTDRSTATGYWEFAHGVRNIDFTEMERFNHVERLVAGVDASEIPSIKVFDAESSELLFAVDVFESTFRGGVRVATGDINVDGIPDIIAAPGPGRAPLIKVYDGWDGTLLTSFLAYDENDADGIFVATGQVTGNRSIDIVTSPGPGIVPGNIHIFENRDRGQEFALARSFTPFESWYTRGASVAVADFNQDGVDDIVAARLHGKAEVAVFDVNVSNAPVELGRFLGLDSAYRGGLHVATGDYLGTSVPDIIISTGYNGQNTMFSSQALVFDGSNLQFSLENPVAPDYQFQAFVDSEFNPRASLRMVGKDFDLDGTLDRLFATQGRYGGALSVFGFEPLNGDFVSSLFLADSEDWNEGYFVG